MIRIITTTRTARMHTNPPSMQTTNVPCTLAMRMDGITICTDFVRMGGVQIDDEGRSHRQLKEVDSYGFRTDLI